MKKRSFLLMLLAVSLFSSCKDDETVFVPEGIKTLVDSDLSYSTGGNNFNMVYIPEVVVQQSVDQNLEDSLKLVVNPSYYIMQTEVTQGLYESVMGSNPSWSEYVGKNLPVNNLNLMQCYYFGKALTEKLGIPEKSNQRFRLPSSREWVIAARGGSLSSTTEYSGSDDLNAVAWYNGNSDGHIHTVGQKSPNQLGLYDMSGNVAEWTNDTSSRIDLDKDENKSSATGSTYGGNFESTVSMCSISGTSSSLTSSTSSANNTHYTNGMRMAKYAAADTLLRLSDFDNVAGKYKWKVVPVVSGNTVVFDIYDNIDVLSYPKYKMTVNLVNNKTISKWEFFPSTYYILSANGSDCDITGKILDVENNITYRIKSGIMAVYSRTRNGENGEYNEGWVNMNGMTLVANSETVVKSLVGASALTVSDFDLSQVPAIYPKLDSSDPTGRTCLFIAKEADGTEIATASARLTSSAPVSSWNLYKEVSLNVGSEVEVTATTPDGQYAEFTEGTLSILSDVKISFNATGTFNGNVYNVTTVNTTGKAISIKKHDVSDAVATVKATGNVCAVHFGGSYGSIEMTLSNPSGTWNFGQSGGYVNYQIDTNDSAGEADGFISEAKVLSDSGWAAINSGAITFGYDVVKPSMVGWVNYEFVEITGTAKTIIK